VKKFHDNTNIDYFYNSGIDYLSKCFLEIRKVFETFLFSSIKFEEEKQENENQFFG
jgi:hypothetical protein